MLHVLKCYNVLQMQAYYSTYNELLKENLPQLYDYFTTTTLTPDLYLLDWIYTVFTKAMNLDLASRVWDVFLRDGDQFLFQTALGMLCFPQTLDICFLLVYYGCYCCQLVRGFGMTP